MMSRCRILTWLLLFLSASPFLISHLSTDAASTSSPNNRPRITYVNDLGSDDYDDDYDSENDSSLPKTIIPANNPVLYRRPELCKQNPCSENERPCSELKAETGCLCPGLSGAEVPPHAPRIQGLLPISEGVNRGKVEIQWCAPSSVVSGYRVVIEGNESGTLKFGQALRRGLMGPLEVGTRVCIEAVNEAGQSEPSEFSCRRYALPESSDKKLLAGIIGGGVALLLIIIIVAVILWKHQMYVKSKNNSTNGIGNTS